MAGKSFVGGKLVTIREAAKQLDFPEHAIRKLAKEGRVPGLVCGTRFYVNIERFKKQILDEAHEDDQ